MIASLLPGTAEAEWRALGEPRFNMDWVPGLAALAASRVNTPVQHIKVCFRFCRLTRQGLLTHLPANIIGVRRRQVQPQQLHTGFMARAPARVSMSGVNSSESQ
jgi:hypothetical protein